MASDAFDAIVSCLDSPLIVVTASAGAERAGCLVGFHCQSSIEPKRYAVWLSKANHTYRVALQATHLGVHFLSSHDLWLAELFGTQSGDDVDKFAELPPQLGTGGVPLLRQCPNRLICRRTALLDEGGDHICLITELIEAQAGEPFRPLRLSQAAHLDPGHDSQERRIT